MCFSGLLVGGGAFLLIGLFHPLVIKGEYYWDRNICWASLVFGASKRCPYTENALKKPFHRMWSETVHGNPIVKINLDIMAETHPLRVKITTST